MSLSYDEWKKKDKLKAKPGTKMPSFHEWKASRVDSGVDKYDERFRTHEDILAAKELNKTYTKPLERSFFVPDEVERDVELNKFKKDSKQKNSFYVPDEIKAQPKDRNSESVISKNQSPKKPEVKNEKASLLSRMLQNSVTVEPDSIAGAMFNKDNVNNTLAEKFGANLRFGTGTAIEGLGGAARWLGGKDNNPLADGLQKAADFTKDGFEGAGYSKDFDFKTAITDPEFYATSVTRAIPQLVTSIVPALGASKLVGMIPKIKNARKLYNTIFKSLGGAGAATTIDSSIEAGSVYDEAISRGMTEDEANSAAIETFKWNFAATGGSTFGEFVLGLSPIGKNLNKISKVGSIAARTAGGAALEGGQEGVQELISSNALGDDFSWTDPSTIEAMTIGAILGGTVTGGMATMTETMSKEAPVRNPVSDIVERTIDQLPPDVRTEFEDMVFELRSDGHTHEDAVEVAIEKMAIDNDSILDIINGATQSYVADAKREQQTRSEVEVTPDGKVTSRENEQVVDPTVVVEEAALAERTAQEVVPQLPAPQQNEQTDIVQQLTASMEAKKNEMNAQPQVASAPEIAPPQSNPLEGIGPNKMVAPPNVTQEQSELDQEVLTEPDESLQGEQSKPLDGVVQASKESLASLASGTMVRLKGTKSEAFVEVVDASDPSSITVQNEQGREYKVGRSTVEQIYDDAPPSEYANADNAIDELAAIESQADLETEAISEVKETAQEALPEPENKTETSKKEDGPFKSYSQDENGVIVRVDGEPSETAKKFLTDNNFTKLNKKIKFGNGAKNPIDYELKIPSNPEGSLKRKELLAEYNRLNSSEASAVETKADVEVKTVDPELQALIEERDSIQSKIKELSPQGAMLDAINGLFDDSGKSSKQLIKDREKAIKAAARLADRVKPLQDELKKVELKIKAAESTSKMKVAERKEEPKVESNKEKAPEGTMDRISWMNKKFRNLDYTAAELREQFEWLRENEEQAKKDIYDYIKTSDAHKRKRENTKQELVDRMYQSALERPAYGDDSFLSIRHTDIFGSEESQNESRLKQLEEKINSITDESIAEYIGKIQAERDEKAKATTSPETIKDFIYKRDTVGLTAEDQSTFDELQALKTREKQTAEKTSAPSSEVISKGDYTITPDKDTRDNSDIWIVKPKSKLEKAEYMEVNKSMKALGGHYSRFKKGFLFKEDPTTKLEGDISEVVASGNVRDSSRIAEKLRTVADNAQKTIDDKRNDNRLTNTAKRATQDAYARDEADAIEKQQGVMRRIADAIENGEAVFLDGVSARTHVETLDRVLLYAYRERMNKEENSNLRPNEREQLAKKPLTVEEINAIDIPKVRLYPDNVERIVKAMTGTKGLGRALAKVSKELNVKKGKADNYLNGELIREDMLKVVDAALKNEDVRYYAQSIKESYDVVKRLEAMNLGTPQLLRSGIREYIKYVEDVGENTGQKQKDEKRKREAELSKLNIPGFFPTPTKVIDRMLEEAEIEPGMKVLEPSAGKGNIADRIRDEHKDAELDVVEYNNTLNEYLSSQDYNVVGNDFLEFDGAYDRILMNPPFEKGQDIEHIRHAYELLEPGGKVVAIMSEGPFFRSDKKATEFREWLEELDGVSEQLEDGSFKGSERTTGVATRLVTIDKPVSEVATEAAGDKVVGNSGTTFTEQGTKIEFEYQVVEADTLIASNDSVGNVNKDYPQELQPRDRTRKASQAQIQNIAQKMNPELLGESAKASDGAPIVGPDMVVESGNGRTIAIQKMYNDNMKTMGTYATWLDRNASKFGLDEDALMDMDNPVLVRVRKNEVDRKTFVNEANESNVSAMSSTEQAKSDASGMTSRVMHLFSPAENGDLNTPANRAFVTAFVSEVVAGNDRGSMVTANGDLSQEGLTRVRNAVFAKAYGDVDAISLVSESTDNNVRTVTNAMLQAAPKFAIMKEQIENGNLYDLDITTEIVEAMTQLVELREEGTTVKAFLDQVSLFEEMSDLSKDMLTIYDSKDFKRSTKALNELFSNYVEVLEAAGDPKQESLFASSIPTKAEILEVAMKRRGSNDKGQTQTDLFEDATESANGTGKKTGKPKSGKVKDSHTDTFVRNRERKAAEPNRDMEDDVNEESRDTSVKRSEIIKYIKDHFDTTIDVGKTRGKEGLYKNKFAIIRTKNYADFEVIMHELGHRIDTKLRLSLNPAIRKELIEFAEANLELPESMNKATRAKEGVAEYFRQVFYNETEANISYKDLSSELKKEIRDGLDKVGWTKPTRVLQELTSSWMNRSAEQERAGIVNEIGSGRRKKRTLKRWMMDVYTDVFDKDHPIWEANRLIEKELKSKGLSLPAEAEAYVMAVATRGTSARAVQFTKFGTFNTDFNRKNNEFEVTGESLEAILKDVDDREGFGQYLAVKHAYYLKTEKGKVNTPITEELQKEYLDNVDPKIEALAERIYGYQRRLLQVLVDGGLIDKDLPAKLEEEYPYYVPLYRDMSSDSTSGSPLGGGRSDGFANQQQGIKRMSDLGSSRNIINPLESIVKNTHLYFSLADRNSVGAAMASWADPDSDIATEVARDIIEEVPNSFSVTDVALKQLHKTLLDAGLEEDILDGLNMEETAKIFNPVFKPNAAKNEVLVWIDGKPKLFLIRDKSLYNAISAQDNPVYNALMNFAAHSNKALRFGITASPFFTVRTFVRSIFQMAIKTKAKGLNYYIQLPMLGKAMFDVMRKNGLYQEWLASGGGQSTLVAIEQNYLDKAIDGIALNKKSWNLLKGKYQHESNRDFLKIMTHIGKNTALSPLKGLQWFNDSLDQSLKLAEYKVVKKQSKGNVQKAMMASRDADLDYARFGSPFMRKMNSVTLFWNISFQGVDNVAREFKKHPVRMTARGLLTTTLPTILLYLMNYDDEDYHELNSYEKDMNWMWKLDDGTFAKIPIPFELGILFKTVPEKLVGDFMDYQTGQDKQSWKDFRKNISKTMMPSFIPTAIDVAVKYAAEKDVTNDWDFVPAHLKRESLVDQYDENTSEAMKWLGKKLNKSPMVLEGTFKAQFAQAGEFGLHAVDKGLDMAGVVERPDLKGLKRNYVERYVTSSIDDGSTASINDFYEKMSELETESDGDARSELMLKAYQKANADMRSIRKVRDGMLYNRLTQPTGEPFPKSERKRIIDLSNKALRDIARFTQGKKPLEPEIADEALYLINGINKHTKAVDKQENKDKKARQKAFIRSQQ